MIRPYVESIACFLSSILIYSFLNIGLKILNNNEYIEAFNSIKSIFGLMIISFGAIVALLSLFYLFSIIVKKCRN